MGDGIERIEQLLMLDDPRFADGLRTGMPCSPREYRRRRWLLLLTLLFAVTVGAVFALLWGIAFIVPVVVLTPPAELMIWVAAAPH
jgi:hypothetical protein